MPVRVKNSTTGAGSDSGKKPVCVQAPLLLQSEKRNAGLTTNVKMLMITMRSIAVRRTRVKTHPRPKCHPVHEWAKPYSSITLNVVYKRFPFASVSNHMLPISHDKSAVTSYQHVMTKVSDDMSRQQATQSQTGSRSGTDIISIYWAQHGRYHAFTRWNPDQLPIRCDFELKARQGKSSAFANLLLLNIQEIPG